MWRSMWDPAEKLSSIGSDVRIVAIRRLGYHLEVAEA